MNPVNYQEYQHLLQSSKRSAELLMDTYGPWDVRVGETYCSLGNLFSRMAMNLEASVMYEKGLEILEKNLSHEDPRVAGTRYNIGLVNCKLKRFRRALPQLEESLKSRRAVLGPFHPDVADTLTCVGGALASLGQHQEALDRYSEAIDLRRANLRENFSAVNALSIATTLRCASSALRMVGDLNLATSHDAEAYSIFLCHLGSDHPLTINTARSAFSAVDNASIQDQAQVSTTTTIPVLTGQTPAVNNASDPLSESSSNETNVGHDEEEFRNDLDLVVQQMLLNHTRAASADIGTAPPAPSDPALFTPPSSPPPAKAYRPHPRRIPPSLTRPGNLGASELLNSSEGTKPNSKKQ